MTAKRLDLTQGTLNIIVLQTLSAMGALHGYGVARHIEQISGNQVQRWERLSDVMGRMLDQNVEDAG